MNSSRRIDPISMLERCLGPCVHGDPASSILAQSCKFSPKFTFRSQDRRFQFEIWNPMILTQWNPRRACTDNRGENKQRTGNGRGGHLSEFEIWNFGYSDFEFFGEETFLMNLKSDSLNGGLYIWTSAGKLQTKTYTFTSTLVRLVNVYVLMKIF